MVSIGNHVCVYLCKDSCKNSLWYGDYFEVNVGMQQGSALSP